MEVVVLGDHVLLEEALDLLALGRREADDLLEVVPDAEDEQPPATGLQTGTLPLGLRWWHPN